MLYISNLFTDINHDTSLYPTIRNKSWLQDEKQKRRVRNNCSGWLFIDSLYLLIPCIPSAKPLQQVFHSTGHCVQAASLLITNSNSSDMNPVSLTRVSEPNMDSMAMTRAVGRWPLISWALSKTLTSFFTIRSKRLFKKKREGKDWRMSQILNMNNLAFHDIFIALLWQGFYCVFGGEYHRHCTKNNKRIDFHKKNDCRLPCRFFCSLWPLQDINGPSMKVLYSNYTKHRLKNYHPKKQKLEFFLPAIMTTCQMTCHCTRSTYTPLYGAGQPLLLSNMQKPAVTSLQVTRALEWATTNK